MLRLNVKLNCFLLLYVHCMFCLSTVCWYVSFHVIPCVCLYLVTFFTVAWLSALVYQYQLICWSPALQQSFVSAF